MGGFAWVTLTTNDSYSLGALVLAHSLRRVGSPHDLVVLITPGVSQSMREKLASVFTLVREVDVLDSKDAANLAVLQRPELGITFTKLHCWRLTQYDKCVFVDADALVVKNCDELFEREELSAAPDVGWPDCFNSGVFVYKPSEETFNSLLQFAATHGSFDGADQGLLNMYFNDWAHKDISKHLPFIYNMCSTATYSYSPAFNMYGQNVRIIHFIGATKPWLQHIDTITGIVQPPSDSGHVQPLLQVWWNIFHSNVQTQLSSDMGGLAGALSQLSVGVSRSEEQQAIEDHVRKQNWEEGQIDYMGQDSFDNILKKINETLESASQEQTSSVKETQQPKKSGSKDSEVEAAVQESDVVLSAKEEGEETCKPLITPGKELTANKNENPQIESSSAIEVKEIDSTNLQQTGIAAQSVADQITPIDNVQIIDQANEAVLPSEVLAPTVLDIKQPETSEQNIVTESIQQLTEKTTEALINATDSSLAESSVLTKSESEIPDETVKKTVAQNIPETITECPVPIQVAESVLQAEPNESATAISDTPIESKETDSAPKDVTSLTSEVSQIIQEEVQPSEDKIQLTEQSEIKSQVAAPIQETDSVPEPNQPVQESSISLEDESKPQPQLDLPVPGENQCPVENSEQTVQAVQLVQQTTEPNAQDTPLTSGATLPEIQRTELTTEESTASGDGSLTDKPDESASQKSKLTVILPQSEVNQDQSSSEKQSLTADPNAGLEGEKIEKKDLEMATSIGTDECLIKSDKSNDAKVPGTPIITEPTPPTSPPFEIQPDQVVQEKTQPGTGDQSQKDKEAEAPSIDQSKIQEAEKTEQSQQQSESLESASSPESEGSSKKNNKKNSKKGVKKSKENDETEESSSTDKPTNIPKDEKKLTQSSSSTSLDTDKIVPETPPPSGAATSEVPVPPKRKTKNTSSSKASSKKSD